MHPILTLMLPMFFILSNLTKKYLCGLFHRGIFILLIFVYISEDLMYNNMDNRIMGFCYEKTNNVYKF